MAETAQKIKDVIQEWDPFTVPNGITLGRLIFSPKVAKKLRDDPQGQWVKAGLYCLTDKLDGVGAKQGGKIPWLARLGFRTSKLGKNLDPVCDQTVIPQMVWAGTQAGVIPKHLALTSFTQKAVTSGLAVRAAAEGVEINVSPLGQAAELWTNFMIGGLFPVQNIENPNTKRLTQTALVAGAYLGVAAAAVATVGYEQQRREQLAQQ
jgi:phosphatidylglycerophosphate synthase